MRAHATRAQGVPDRRGGRGAGADRRASRLAATTRQSGGAAAGGGGGGRRSRSGLITKTETNPFFVKMKEGAQARRQELGARAAVVRRQEGRRQREPGRGGREPDRRRREGHPDHAERLEGDRARRSTRRARPGLLVVALDTQTRAARRGRRHVRDRQLPGRSADRPVGEGEVREGRQGGEDRHARPQPRGRVGRRAARPGLHGGLRHRRRRQHARSATRTIRGSSATT